MATDFTKIDEVTDTDHDALPPLNSPYDNCPPMNIADQKKSEPYKRTPSTTTSAQPQRRPFVDWARNESKWDATMRLPRLRRYILVYLLLLLSCLGMYRVCYKRWLQPYLQEQAALRQSLDEAGRTRFGWFGANINPKFTDLIQVTSLPEHLLPYDTHTKHGKGSHKKRLIFIGDVHGCRAELVQLLDDLSFNEATDHLVFTGDLIAKGPDSPGVIDLVSSLNASCVRGNHEDRVLLAYRAIHSNRVPTAPSDAADSDRSHTSADSERYSNKHTKHQLLARALSRSQAAYLNACPVILDVGFIPGMGKVLTVHAGLVSGVAIDHQDPINVMTMRSVDLRTHLPFEDRSGTQWTKLWNYHQRHHVHEKDHTTVIYGHDSPLGLQLRDYTKGIDTGCVSGGRLTALVLEGRGDRKVKQRMVSVPCQNYRTKVKKAG